MVDIKNTHYVVQVKIFSTDSWMDYKSYMDESSANMYAEKFNTKSKKDKLNIKFRAICRVSQLIETVL